MGISKEEFDEFKDEHLSLRLFKYLICNKPNSPNGYLATYRCLKQNKKLFFDLHTPDLPDYGPQFDRPNILSFTNTQIHKYTNTPYFSQIPDDGPHRDRPNHVRASQVRWLHLHLDGSFSEVGCQT